MPDKHDRRFVCSWIAWALAPAVLAAGALGAEKDRQQIGQGEVSADNVHVRCGDSTNHYPVCKLSAGERVTIVGERGNWYEILPPEKTFSLISAEYVDTVDHVNGVVNGNNVRVRAGSLLKDWQHRRDHLQTKLSKGAEVSILGANPDGFLRIAPPKGVTMWINRQYVELVPDALAEAERDLGEAITPKEQSAEAATTKSDDKAVDEQAEAVSPSPFAALPTSEQRKQLEQLDVQTRRELSKPLLDRDFEPLVEGYRAVAEREDDVFAQRYAKRRIEQICNMQEVIDAVRRMRELGQRAELVRRDAFEKRASIPVAVPPPPSGLDAQGELRVSALYPPGSHPRRYRLVDTTGAGERTIGYVEIPPGSPLKVEGFLGRYVGVRASGSRLQVGGVNPVPIYVASELVLLQPAAGEGGSVERGK